MKNFLKWKQLNYSKYVIIVELLKHEKEKKDKQFNE